MTLRRDFIAGRHIPIETSADDVKPSFCASEKKPKAVVEVFASNTNDRQAYRLVSRAYASSNFVEFAPITIAKLAAIFASSPPRNCSAFDLIVKSTIKAASLESQEHAPKMRLSQAQLPLRPQPVDLEQRDYLEYSLISFQEYREQRRPF